MSGPVTSADATANVEPPVVAPVRRALPQRTRRMVGAWCFVDHMGPATADERGLGVAPHTHIGLQTVTWLLAGAE